MAQQATLKRPITVPATEPKKAGHSRAKGARTFDYTKFRQSIRDDKDFGLYLAGYPNKTGILAYIYRLKPAIDYSLINISENSIYKTSTVEEMTQEFIAGRFGRGKYMLKLSDANRPKGEAQVCTTWFLVDDPDLIPIYDPRTLKIGDPENQDEVARLLQAGVLVRDAQTGIPRIRTQNDGDSPAGAASNGHSSSAGDLFPKDVLGQVIMKLVTNSVQNSSDSVKQAVEVARLLQPPPTPQVSAEQVAELVYARMERTQTRSNSEGDFFQTYERVSAFIEKVKGPAPIAIPEGAAGWAAAAPQILAQVTALIPLVLSGVAQLRNSRAPVQHRRPPANGQQPEQQAMTLPDRIAQIATLGFTKMGEGVNGFDFAAWVCNYHPGGLEVYRVLEPQGPPGVMGLAAMNPATAPFLTDPAKRAQVEEFLLEFFSFDPDGGSGEELPGGSAGESAAA